MNDLNLLNEFKKALTMEQYLDKLDDQISVHELHFKKAETEQYNLNNIPDLKILVITEPWCSDSSAIFPVILRFFENQPVEIKIALRDENPELMNRFLTNGTRAIPIILVLDEQGEVHLKFGPRPAKAQAIFEKYRRDINEGKIERKDVIKKIRTFYAKDRGNAILEEFVILLENKINDFRGNIE